MLLFGCASTNDCQRVSVRKSISSARKLSLSLTKFREFPFDSRSGWLFDIKLAQMRMIWKNHAPFVSELGFYRLFDIPGLCDERKGIAVGRVNQYSTSYKHSR